jgi:Periplasmic binding protein domain
VLQGPIGQSAETDRTQGVKNILAKSPDIKLLAIQPANWDRTQAYNLMQDWLSRYGSEVKGVIAENDDMAIGAIRALQEKGLAGKIPVGGVDAIKDGLREIKSGNLVATNLQNAAIELGMALQATVDLLDNRPVPQTALLNMPVIKKDKVDYYYDQLYVKPQDFLKTLPDLVKRLLYPSNLSGAALPATSSFSNVRPQRPIAGNRSPKCFAWVKRQIITRALSASRLRLLHRSIRESQCLNSRSANLKLAWGCMERWAFGGRISNQPRRWFRE